MNLTGLKKLVVILIGLSFSGCGVERPSDEEGFCFIYSHTSAECSPLDKGEPIPGKKFDKEIVKMLGYSCMGPDFNRKIQMYIEELKQKCGDPCK